MENAKVSLINYTPDAEETLIFTKNTRLTMSDDSFEQTFKIPTEEKRTQLEYMSRTIPSSWEFIDYIFVIENVTRAFTHQFVRTRHGSYAQQTMRVLEMSQFSYHLPDGIAEDPTATQIYDETMQKIQKGYDELLELGVKAEDARGVLPTNIHTNICAKFNLRTLAEMAKSRLGLRTQDEYRDVLNKMLDEVIKIHPWAELFLFPKGQDAFERLDSVIQDLQADFDNNRDNSYSQEFINDCKKDLDILRKQ